MLDDELTPYAGWKVRDTFETTTLCYKYVDLDVRDVRVNDLPAPTVQPRPSTPSGGNTVEVPDDDRRDDRDDDRRERKKKKSSGNKIKGFFKSIFNEGAGDPSQLPSSAGGQAPDPAPIDDKVQLDFVEKAPEKSVDPEDRSELIKLRPQPAIKADWYTMNGLDPKVAAEHEKDAYEQIAAINNVFGYISTSALWNQVDKLAMLATQKVDKFTATISKVVVTVENTMDKGVTDAKQAVVDVHARVKRSLGLIKLQAIEKVTPVIKGIIGDTLKSPTSATNPYRSRSVYKEPDTLRRANAVTSLPRVTGKKTA